METPNGWSTSDYYAQLGQKVSEAMTPSESQARQQRWETTQYGFTDGVHQHHCMVTPDEETVAYLNAPTLQGDAEARRLLERWRKDAWGSPDSLKLDTDAYLAPPGSVATAPDEAVIRGVLTFVESGFPSGAFESWWKDGNSEASDILAHYEQSRRGAIVALRALLPDDKEGTNA